MNPANPACFETCSASITRPRSCPRTADAIPSHLVPEGQSLSQIRTQRAYKGKRCPSAPLFPAHTHPVPCLQPRGKHAVPLSAELSHTDSPHLSPGPSTPSPLPALFAPPDATRRFDLGHPEGDMASRRGASSLRSSRVQGLPGPVISVLVRRSRAMPYAVHASLAGERRGRICG